jgi:ABC-type transporter Mla subunit MlaD
VSDTVELDELLSTFDAKTREAFQQWLQGQAEGLQGQGKNLNSALGNLAPFAIDTNTLLRILKAQGTDVRGIVNGTGDVFNALTARDDQLASLITNSNAVFQTTAQQDEDLKALFRALPTFEKESTQTVKRLDAFAKNTDPLVTQLRPVARELSPTLRELQGLAPDLNAFFRDLDPLVDASEKGLPAVQSFLDQLAPFLGEFDAPLAQLNPILSFVGQYPRELNAFFANVAAATQAAAPSGDSPPIHYLRTMNPITAENLAIYPRRLPTNRPNPYQHPNAFDQLAQGLYSYETRQCLDGRGVPAFATPDLLLGAVGGSTNSLTALLPEPLRSLSSEQATQLVSVMDTFVAPALQLDLLTNLLGGSLTTGLLGNIAPPCKQSPDFTTRAGTHQYPQIEAAPNGHTAGP